MWSEKSFIYPCFSAVSGYDLVAGTHLILEL